MSVSITSTLKPSNGGSCQPGCDAPSGSPVATAYVTDPNGTWTVSGPSFSSMSGNGSFTGSVATAVATDCSSWGYGTINILNVTTGGVAYLISVWYDTASAQWKARFTVGVVCGPDTCDIGMFAPYNCGDIWSCPDDTTTENTLSSVSTATITLTGTCSGGTLSLSGTLSSSDWTAIECYDGSFSTSGGFSGGVIVTS